MTSSLAKINEPSRLKSHLSSHKKPLFLKRNVIKIFTCSACFIMFLLRYNISVAIVAITDEVELVPHGHLDGLGNFTLANETDDSTQVFRKKYPFDQYLVSNILASYFYGYTLFQLPAGRLSEILGAKHVLGFGTLISGILSLFTPMLLDLSPYALMVGRIFIGIFHATVLSCGYTFISQWLPSDQRTNAITLLNVAFESGGIAAFFLTGLICDCDVLGWRWSFYIFAIIAMLWFIPYYFLVYSTPEDDPHLSEYEKNLIEMERKAEYANQNISKNMKKISPKFDWKIILTSKPVIASCIGKSAIGLLYYLVTTKMPAYFHDIFDVPMKSNGAFTALTVAGSLASKTLCLKLSNYVLRWKSMSLTTVRKIFQSIALLVPSLAMLTITLKNDSQALDTCLVVLCMFGMGFVCLGDTPITADFAKDLSGSLFGFTNTWACLMGIASPLIVGAFMENVDNKNLAWNYSFYCSIGYNVFGAIIFILFASAEPQPWAESKFVPIEEYTNGDDEKRSKRSPA